MQIFLSALTLGLLVAAIVLLYWLAPAVFVDLLLRMQRAAVGMRRRELRVGGFNWAYLDSGGRGEPLVLVHGFGGDKSNWLRIAGRLRKRYRLIAPDLPGFGDSDAPLDARYRIQDQVERLHDFLVAIGIDRAHVAGNSMGGYVAALYAATYPAATASLWLITNAGVRTAKNSELLEIIESGGPNPLMPTTLAEFRALMPYVMSRPPYVPRAVLDVLGARAIAAGPLRQQQIVDVLDHSPHLEDVLGGLTVPTHILWGEEDRLVDVSSVFVLSRLLPHASHTIMPGIGHVPMIEAPRATVRDYLAFRARIQRESAGKTTAGGR